MRSTSPRAAANCGAQQRIAARSSESRRATTNRGAQQRIAARSTSPRRADATDGHRAAMDVGYSRCDALAARVNYKQPIAFIHMSPP